MVKLETPLDLLPELVETQDREKNWFFCTAEFVYRILATQPRDPAVQRAMVLKQVKDENERRRTTGEPLITDGEAETLIQDQIAKLALGKDTAVRPAANAAAPDSTAGGAEAVEEEMTPEDAAEVAKAPGRCVFFTDDLGPWIGVYQLKSAMREMAKSIGITGDRKRSGVKQSVQVLLDPFGASPTGEMLPKEQSERLHFYGDNGEICRFPDGAVRRTGHVTDKAGERSIVQVNDYMEQRRIHFLLGVVAGLNKDRAAAAVTDDDVLRVLAHIQTAALGAARSQGYGKFTITRLEKLTDKPLVRK